MPRDRPDGPARRGLDPPSPPMGRAEGSGSPTMTVGRRRTFRSPRKQVRSVRDRRASPIRAGPSCRDLANRRMIGRPSQAGFVRGRSPPTALLAAMLPKHVRCQLRHSPGNRAGESYATGREALHRTPVRLRTQTVSLPGCDSVLVVVRVFVPRARPSADALLGVSRLAVLENGQILVA
jgi:hypothetical protein